MRDFQPAPQMLAFMTDMKANRNTTDHLMAATPATSDDIEKVFAVGSRLTDQARTEEAAPYVERVMALDPDDARGYGSRALLVKADMERKHERYEQAAKLTEKLVASYPDSELLDRALSMQAYYYKKMGNNEGAAQAYRQVIERHPEDPSSLNAFAWFCATAGIALEEATAVAVKAVKLSNDSPGILDTLAEVYYARGMYPDAIATINKAIAQEPEDAYFKKQLSKFQAAQEGAEE